MSNGTVAKVKHLWNIWDIRVLLLVSLLIQILLTFLAPLRKHKASGLLKTILWLLYLTASANALFIISQITGNEDSRPFKIDLLAFWAPFLLLHLGGPDTITALALEDNELWLRHALELLTQLGVTSYVFVKAALKSKSWMWIPTLLMFIDGLIKYVERTQALYKASIDTFRDSLETDPEPGPNYARFMDVYHSSLVAAIPTHIINQDGSSLTNQGDLNNDRQVERQDENSQEDPQRKGNDDLVLQAYKFYTKFKSLLADNFLSLKELKECRDTFLNLEEGIAIKIIEIELNFIYDVFFTKAFLINSRQAYFRAISYVSVIASLVFFYLLDKKGHNKVDIVITYILLGGALTLDVCAIVMLVVSDWYIIINERRIENNQWGRHISTTLIKWFRWGRLPEWKRWSRSISRYNLLQRSFKDPPAFYKLAGIKKIKDIIIGFFYVTGDTSKEKIVVKFIDHELKRKAEAVKKTNDNLTDIKEACLARGDLRFDEDEYLLIADYLKPWTTEVDYDESLFIWHIATDICYHTFAPKEREDSLPQGIKDSRDISKVLSDYMAYLMLRQQTLVSTVVGMSDRRFEDTRAEARKFYSTKTIDSFGTDYWLMFKDLMRKVICRDPKYGEENQIKKENEFLKELCTNLLTINADIQPLTAKGDKSKSVLFEACRLAKQLNMLADERQWKIISKVWLELMCYAAVRCSPRSHVAQLNRGGELITLVWLLMAHFGFGEHFLQNQGYGLTKLIIKK